MLPKSYPPQWFCEKIIINNASVIIIVDDDPSVHDLWKERLFHIKNKILYFHDIDKFIQYHTLGSNNNNLYLIDYEFSMENKNGIELIKILNIRYQTILVTNSFEEVEVRKFSDEMQFKILPKPYISYVPIIRECEQNAVVLIDNDELMQSVWKLAGKKSGLNVDTYSSVNDFIEKFEIYNQKTIIYIDSDLGDNIKGELQAKKIFDKGFSEIYLTTGFSADQVQKFPWIKSIIGKTPPFYSSIDFN